MPSGSSVCSLTALVRAREPLEEPPGHTVLHRHHDRVGVVQRLELVGDAGDLVRLQRQHDHVLRSERRRCRRTPPTTGARELTVPSGSTSVRPVRADRLEVGAPRQHADVSRRRRPGVRRAARRSPRRRRCRSRATRADRGTSLVSRDGCPESNQCTDVLETRAMAERAHESNPPVATVRGLLSPEAHRAGTDRRRRRVDRPRRPCGRRSTGSPQRLRAAGLDRSDRIAIVLPNGPEMVIVLLAAMSVGCAAPLNPKYREDEFRFYLDDLRAAALMTRRSGTAARRSRGDAGDARSRSTSRSNAGSPSDRQARRRCARRCRAADRAAETADDEALVLHTSGTTSRPKIVPLRQRNLADVGAQHRRPPAA